MTDLLRTQGLSKAYDGNAALRDVSMSIARNEYISLLGPSGSGKTVLLRLIAGFEQPDSGSLEFDGKDLGGVSPHKRGIGFVFQNFALFPHLTVQDNIAFGLASRVENPVTDAAELRRRVGRAVELVGLAGLEQRGVHQISGGQRQRVALARTLVTEPRLVLLDEPLGALDANLRMRMRGELRRIRSELGVTFLHVTGSETEALAMGDRIIVLGDGRIRQFDVPDTVYNKPASPDVARALNCYNFFSGRIAGDRFATDIQTFAIAAPRVASAVPAYAIRQDLIGIKPEAAGVAAGEAGVRALYLASEYTGAAYMYFFKTADGRIVEVENHLSHREAESLDPGTSYMLAWKAADGLVFG